MPIKYLLFCGSFYYPSGGWEDFHGVFSTLDGAKNAALKKSIEEEWYNYGWYHIVQIEDEALHTATIIESGDTGDLVVE